jgi:choline kinase/phosphoglycolate phosphatase-like HAD superfamily hydrolase/phosphatidylglycerophosphate synthase
MEPRRLVVLAAGLGSRLGPKVAAKPLAQLGGLSLLERSIVGAHEAGFSEVVVVTGHHADRVARHALDVSRRRGIPVAVARNDRYEEGNGLSVLAAAELVGRAPFALVMADHVFPVAALRRLRSTSVADDEVVVAVDRTLGRATGVDAADATKVALTGMRVDDIGKELVEFDAFDVGAFVAGPVLLDAVAAASALGDSSLSGAVRDMAGAGRARALPLHEGEWWFDVDTPEDRRRGNRYLYRGSGKAHDGAVAARVNRVLSQRIVTPSLLRAVPRITPNQVTLLAFAAAVAASGAFVLQAPVLAAVLVVAATVLDGSDGEVARLARRSSPFGGFFDAVLDRVADGLLFTGAAIYLASSGDLHDLFASAQVPVAVGVVGVALVGHLLVSYTTAKARIDLGHRYRGALVAGGRGRDLRLLVVTVGALAAEIHAGMLLAAMAGLAVLCSWIVVVRLRASWWACGNGAVYHGVRAVAFDLDGTLADTMTELTTLATQLVTTELGVAPDVAARRYLATAGDDFRTQLDAIAPGDPRLNEVAAHFETAKDEHAARVRLFPDAVAALDRLAESGLPVLVCSSTRAELVVELCRRHGIGEGASAPVFVDGWRPGRPKTEQLAAWLTRTGVPAADVLLVGDARRDGEIAHAVGTRFVGIARPGHTDGLAGSGLPVVASLRDLTANVLRAQRSPVEIERVSTTASVGPHDRDDPQLGPLQVGGVVGPHETADPGLGPDGGDGAVEHLDVPVDLRPGVKRPGHRGPDGRIVGEDRDGAVG